MKKGDTYLKIGDTVIIYGNLYCPVSNQNYSLKLPFKFRYAYPTCSNTPTAQPDHTCSVWWNLVEADVLYARSEQANNKVSYIVVGII